MKRRLITSALPYVNNVPHLGNIIQVLSADCFARFCRLRGYDTCYVCGTDEYGTATETRAAQEGLSPAELCGRYWTIHNDIYKWFNIEFDKFGRTSTPIQTEIVQDIFKKLDSAGFIKEKTIEQLYCKECERFLADRYVLGTCPHCGYSGARGDQCESCGKLLDPTDLKEAQCSTCGKTPELRSTKHLYIDLPALKDKLESWIGKTQDRGRWAKNAVQMTQAWIRDGLHERAITRDLKWGIPVPKAGYENKVFYVWFDAPIGYLSITGSLAEDKGLDWKEFVNSWWKDPANVELFQFIGKDNIPFHTVVFPSSLLGTGEDWTMLYHMSSTEYLNYESGKFSKSKGIGVFGTDVMETGIPADVWRFYIYYNRPEKSDTLFTWKDFSEKVNSELIGNLGNFVNRTLTFVSRYYNGVIPPVKNSDSSFWETVRDYKNKITEKLEWSELRDAFHLIFELSSFANKTFQDGEPWKKRTEDPAAAEELIAGLCYIVRDLAVFSSPYIPCAAEKIAGFFGRSLSGSNKLSWQDTGVPHGIDKVLRSEVLFTKLEEKAIMELREKYSGTQADRAEAQTQHSEAQEQVQKNEYLRFVDRIDLRVAKIVGIEKHPSADKLYVEHLDIAGEERVIVSGLVPYYKEEELLGKHIILVYNLKPAKLRGIESKGMLLAASFKDENGTEHVEVLDAQDTPTGTRVALEGIPQGYAPSELQIDDFFDMPIKVADNFVQFGGKNLTLNDIPVKTKTVLNGDVG
ncbi:MAG: methionine--tRNA ligase [Spirochaetaceae bacterium]|jgi:methionyl-tRNA synthetase|nr:methionine--tRNA ligase [Spirochaetaceae bacterium]